MDQKDGRALLVIGTVGSGKTSVAEALGEELGRAQVANAVVDVDWLGAMWPSPPDDPFNFEITLRNLRAVAANYFAAGVRWLILAGVVESPAGRDACQDALGVPLTVVRLQVDLPTVRERLRRRHADDADGLRWHLERSGELDRILRQARVEDFVVDATHDLVPDVARAVLKGAARVGS